MINVAAHVAAHQSSKRRQQETLEPPPPPTTTPIPPLPPRPDPPVQPYPQYPPQPLSQLPYSTNPLTHLASPSDPSTISLYLTRTDPKGKTFRFATLNTPTGESLYTITYDPDSTYSGSISRPHPPPSTLSPAFHSPFTAHWKRHTFRSEKLKFYFPWPGGKWGFDPAKRRWVSDVDLLPGHEFQWMTMTLSNGYILKCVDTQTGSDVCRVVVNGSNADRAVMEIPVGVIASQEQLDEMVTVAVAMDEKVFDEIVSSGSSEVGSLKNTFEGVNGILGAVSASGGGGGGGPC